MATLFSPGSINPQGFVNIRDFGAIGNGTNDDSTAINAAITYAAAQSPKLAVFIPAGQYRINSQITPITGVSIFGAGMRNSIILPYGSISAFKSSSAVNQATFRDFGIDGTNQSSASYDFSVKGFYIQNMTEVNFVNLWIYNTLATGLGVDFLKQSSIVNCLVESCGRGNSGIQLGGAGIGIGVQSEFEHLTIQGNICRNNKRYGIFCEAQAPATPTKGIRIIGNACYGNQYGIVDAGCNGLVISGNQCYANTKSGIAVNSGSASANPGENTIITNNSTYGNTEYGIHVNTTTKDTPGRYLITNNQIYGNTLHGIMFDVGPNTNQALSHCSIKGNKIFSNGQNGIRFDSNGGTITDLVIDSNEIFNNATGTSNAGNAAAIRFMQSASVVHLRNNRCYDNNSPKKQSYAIYLDASTANLSDISITGNDFRNNLTGTIFVGSGATFSTVRIVDNQGYTLGPTSVSPGASPYTYTAGNTPEMLYISGGTVSAIVKSSVTLSSTTDTQIRLAPSESVTITYSSAPALVADRF